MNVYLRFCSAVYHFYKSRDSSPGVYTFAVSTTLLAFNCFVIYGVVQYVISSKWQLLEMTTYLLFASLGILNFFLVFLSGKYKEIQPSARDRKHAVWYIVISLFLFIGTIILHRIKNVGSL